MSEERQGEREEHGEWSRRSTPICGASGDRSTNNSWGSISGSPSELASPPRRVRSVDISRLEEEVALMRLDKDWKSFLRHWNQPVLRMRVAECMPHLVVMIWTEGFLLLPRKNVPFRGVSMLGPVDEQTVTSTRNMLNTVLTRTRISSAAMLLSLLLIHRYRILPNTECGVRGSEFRTFVIALLLAHKYTEDHPYSNRIWSQLSEIPVRHINALEREFLHCIDHRLSVRFREFQRWVVTLDGKFGWTTSVGSIRQEYRVMPLPPKPEAAPPMTIPQPTLAKYRRLSQIRPFPHGEAILFDKNETNQSNVRTRDTG